MKKQCDSLKKHPSHDWWERGLKRFCPGRSREVKIR